MIRKNGTVIKFLMSLTGLNGLKRALASFMTGLMICTLGIFPVFSLALPASASQTSLGVIYSQQVYRQQQLEHKALEPLLTLLKQVDPNFATLQGKEIFNFKGDVVFFLFDRNTDQEDYNHIASLSATNKPVVLIPVDNELTPAMDQFLRQMGYYLEDPVWMTKQRSLTLNKPTPQPICVLSPGTMVYRISEPTIQSLDVIASVSHTLPAVVAGPRQSLLFTLNVADGCSSQETAVILSSWTRQFAFNRPQAPSPSPAIQNRFSAPPVTSQAALEQNPSSVNVLYRGSSPIESSRSTISEPVEPKPTTLAQDDPRSPFYRTVHEKKPYMAPPSTVKSPPESYAPPKPVTQANTASKNNTIGDYDDSVYSFDGEEQRPDDFKPKWTKDNRTAMADFYNQRMREYYKLLDTVELLFDKYPENSSRGQTIAKAIELSRENKSMFESAWFEQRYTEALVSLENAHSALIGVLFDKVPVSHVEGRAIWLDRGSIIRAGSPEAVRELIQRIAHSGFNVIYFETVNAGYPIYPSQITQQNPQTLGWDPLKVAVDEAHRQNVELHAWVWVFAVGNTRHNKILDQPDSFPGPILSSRTDLMANALRDSAGNLLLPNQHEYWLSPASRKARQFLTSLFSEIVQNYDVDGLQLDYIRYPFQKPGHYMGYEQVSRQRYASETGIGLGGGTQSLKAWQAWKAFQVSSYVKELSEHLKGMKPGLKLSAAVFPMRRYNRMMMIQQDWETWVREGWIETLNPMAYSNSAHSLVSLVDYVHDVGQDKVLVYPGLSLLKLNSVELLDKMEMIREKGLLGTALFAYAHFGPDTQYLMQSGPYREKNIIPPHREPLLAGRQLTNEVLSLVDSLIKTGDQDLNYEMLYEMQHRLKSIDDSLGKLDNGLSSKSDMDFLVELSRNEAAVLERTSNEWLKSTSKDSVEAYQASYLNDRIEKMVRMVNYATYKRQEMPYKASR